MSKKLYNVGMYIRLSRKSINYRGEESLSIENQQAMLSKFINLMPDWIEKRVYIDDGASGTNFNRQGFQDMMEDVKQGIINLILVKDLSRFGRNYLEVGKYLEDELPYLGCRFVALSDGIDTETGENDIMPFVNAINDFYIKNLSERVKSILTVKAKDGQKLSGTAPYGYERNPDANTRLIIDEYAAAVVRRIFQARAEGMGYSLIARMLNKENTLPPRLYYFTQRNRGTKAVCTDIWSIRTVKLILSNEIYIGNTISFKRKLRSYRIHREVKCDESQWIRVLNTHTPIIDKELWLTVQQINKRAKEIFANSRKPQQSLFSRLVICSDCHSNMGYTASTIKYKNGQTAKYGGYNCRTYTRSGSSVCSWHKISECHLKEVILDHIRKIANLITLNEERMLGEIQQRLIDANNANKTDQANERRGLERQLYSLESQIELLYEERIRGTIPIGVFSAKAKEIEAKCLEIEGKLTLLNQITEQTESNLGDTKMWRLLMKESSTISEVDRELLEILICKIEVGEKIALDGVKTQDLRIFYKYSGLC